MGYGTRYEQKTVKAVRGTERIVVAKWQKRGWELVDQTPSSLRTDLTFIRPRVRVTRQALAVVALAVVLVGAIAIGVLTERDDPAGTANVPTASPTNAEDGAANIEKNDSYMSDDDLVSAAAKAGFTCPSPKKSTASLESAPKYIVSCSNERALVSLSGTLTGADAGRVFVLGLEEADFDNGPWLVGSDWALNGPGVAKLQPVMGGNLVRQPAPGGGDGY